MATAENKARPQGAVANKPRDRVKRSVLAIVMAIGGCYSVAYSLASAQARNNVETAHRLAPGNGQITARLALSLLGPNATEAERLRADQLARQALLLDATAVAAVATLGINADNRGDHMGARKVFAYAQSLSRRNLPTQMWFIEDAVGKGNIAEALTHYDIALRTSPQSADLFFPILASASVDSTIRTSLIKMLVGKPLWGDAFISHLADKGPDPQTTATLFAELRRAGGAVPATADAAVLNALAASGHADEAWTYYEFARRPVDRRRSRDPSFTANIEAPSILDWVPVESPGISTSIQRNNQSGAFEYSAPSSVGGALLRQLQLLPPGHYRLTGHSNDVNQPDGERPYWLLTCHDGQELGRVELPKSTQSNGIFTGLMTVPPGCGIQMLQLIARPASAASGMSGLIDRTQLEPVQ